MTLLVRKELLEIQALLSPHSDPPKVLIKPFFISYYSHRQEPYNKRAKSSHFFLLIILSSRSPSHSFSSIRFFSLLFSQSKQQEAINYLKSNSLTFTSPPLPFPTRRQKTERFHRRLLSCLVPVYSVSYPVPPSRRIRICLLNSFADKC